MLIKALCFHRFVLPALGAALVLAAGACFAVAAAGPQLPASPPSPKVVSIEIQPDQLTLHHRRDARQVLVWGIDAEGRRFDFSDDASFEVDSEAVVVDAARYVRPRAVGQATITIKAAGLVARLPVKIAGIAKPPARFVMDVLPIMAKVGCNAGTCHGAQQGRNGFQLSLRGFDPTADYNALVHELQGRRVNRVRPEQSLMLLKATAGVPHEGKQVIKPGSGHYQLVRQWIAEGARFEDPATARANRIDVVPASFELDLPGRSQRIVVLAHHPDGSVRDVTADTIITSNDEEVAKVVGNRVTAIRRGEAAILVRYEGNYTSSRAVVMGDRSGFAFKPMPEWNFIDGHVNAKLKRMKISPSGLCTDAEFVRRLSIDLTGVPPTVAEARAFVQDASPSREKRQKLIDRLIGGRDYVAYWSNKWADLLQCNTKKLGEKGVWVFRDWIRRSIALNKPYDRFARELITASGGSQSNPATGYLLSLGKDVSKVNNKLTVNLNNVDTGKITEDVSQTFLGVRFNCNKCHDHPFERWTQTQYYEFGAFFARVKFKKGEGRDDVVVYTSDAGGEINHPKTSMVMNPKVPYGQDPDLQGAARRRDAFAGWLTSAENPLFARSYVNRIWSYFYGIGIIEPVDDIRASNPPSNPELLDALTEDFIRSGFDSQRLMRNIVSSRTYQLSIKSNEWNRDDVANFSHFVPRRLSAEQLRDAVAQVTGTTLRVPGLPPGMRSVYSPDGMVKGDDFLRLFGRPKRESACECERTSNVSLAHALNLVNGPIISGAVVEAGNGIARLVQQEKDNRTVIENLYYAIFSRPPTEAEVAAIDLGAGNQRLEVAQDLAWALLNSPAFLFNR